MAILLVVGAADRFTDPRAQPPFFLPLALTAA
jgi:hypothetical protein